jgi:hypothetical protein
MEGLEEGEFFIFKDDTMHLVELGRQIGYTPMTMHLTNRRLFAVPQYSDWGKSTTVVSIGSINEFSQSIYNECPVLDILYGVQGESVHILVPDDTNRRCFVEILLKLCQEVHDDAQQSDAYAVDLRHRALNTNSLAEFYSHLHSQSLQYKADVSLEFQEALDPFNLFADLVENSPTLFFCVVYVISAILTAIFRYASFGATVCASILILIIYSGIRRIRKTTELRIEPTNDESREPVKAFVTASDTFRKRCDDHLFWGNKAATLDLCVFLGVVMLLFVILDPFLLFGISLMGMAFFERWDPCGFGCFSSLLSKLILW